MGAFGFFFLRLVVSNVIWFDYPNSLQYIITRLLVPYTGLLVDLRGRAEGRCSKLSSSVCDVVLSLVIPRAGVMLSWSLFCSTNFCTNGMQAAAVKQNSSWNYPKSLVQSE